MSTISRSAIILAIVSFTWAGANSQDRFSDAYYRSYYTGCWTTSYGATEQLITRADGTFSRIKPRAGESGFDKLQGTWRIRSIYGIGKKATVIIFRYATGRKEKLQVEVTSMPAVIYLTSDRKFEKVECQR